MQKSNLFNLICDVARVSGEATPIIAGSQAAYAVMSRLPEVAHASIECDFLFVGGKGAIREKINKELGVLTEYQDEHGYYADAVGLATIVLPEGWLDRLRPLMDANGTVVAQCLDIYDVSTSKLIAGRPKDLTFLESLFASDVLQVNEFLARLPLVEGKVENDVVNNRLVRLIGELDRRGVHRDIVEKLRVVLKERSR